MELDLVRRNAVLVVEEVEERDARELGFRTELDDCSRLRNLSPSLRGRSAVASRARSLGDHRVTCAVLKDEAEVAIGLREHIRYLGCHPELVPLERRPGSRQRCRLRLGDEVRDRGRLDGQELRPVLHRLDLPALGAAKGLLRRCCACTRRERQLEREQDGSCSCQKTRADHSRYLREVMITGGRTMTGS
jgi:hypothetical protein